MYSCNQLDEAHLNIFQRKHHMNALSYDKGENRKKC